MCSTIIVLVIVLPHLNVVRLLFEPASDVWLHIKENLLAGYLSETLRLILGVASGTFLFAVPAAWFVTFYDFPGRWWISFALALPLAVPPYIAAYTYAGMLGYTGFVQRIYRIVSGTTGGVAWLDIMSLKGAVFIFSLFLYPYVYLILRSFLRRQAAQYIEAGRLLGHGTWSIFRRIVLPLSRNVIVAGIVLVLMETLSDYGVVSYFGVGTFSAAVFRAWVSFGDVQSALRLSACLLMMVLFVLGAERWFLRRKGTCPASARTTPMKPVPLKGKSLWAVMTFLALILFFGLVLPLGQMVVWSIQSRHVVHFHRLLGALGNSLWLALLCSSIILVLALIITNYHRLFRQFYSSLCSRLSVLGYSMPGTVVAIVMLLFFLGLDQRWNLAMSSTLLMLVVGYMVRYMAVSVQGLESGFEKIGNRYTESARTLGCGIWRTLFYVDLPMMKEALIGAFILTFVDIVKELPLVLLLRPFNFYTLATRVFEYAHDEMIPESSLASLLIVALSCLPIVLLHRLEAKEERQ